MWQNLMNSSLAVYFVHCHCTPSHVTELYEQFFGCLFCALSLHTASCDRTWWTVLWLFILCTVTAHHVTWQNVMNSSLAVYFVHCHCTPHHVTELDEQFFGCLFCALSLLTTSCDRTWWTSLWLFILLHNVNHGVSEENTDFDFFFTLNTDIQNLSPILYIDENSFEVDVFLCHMVNFLRQCSVPILNVQKVPRRHLDILTLEGQYTVLPQYIRIQLPSDTVAYPGRTERSPTPLQKPQTHVASCYFSLHCWCKVVFTNLSGTFFFRMHTLQKYSKWIHVSSAEYMS
jgi:hypothetical protein